MWAEFAYAKGWGYVWGTYGDVLDDSLFEYKKTQYPDEVGGKADFSKPTGSAAEPPTVSVSSRATWVV